MSKVDRILFKRRWKQRINTRVKKISVNSINVFFGVVSIILSFISYQLSNKVSKQEQRIQKFDSLLVQAYQQTQESKKQTDELLKMSKSFFHISESIDSQLQILTAQFIEGEKQSLVNSIGGKLSFENTLGDLEAMMYNSESFFRDNSFKTIGEKIEFFENILKKLSFELQNKFLLSRSSVYKKWKEACNWCTGKIAKYKLLINSQDANSYPIEVNRISFKETNRWATFFTKTRESL